MQYLAFSSLFVVTATERLSYYYKLSYTIIIAFKLHFHYETNLYK